MLELECPFEFQGCSWPRATKRVKGGYEPEWDIPLMEMKPEVSLEIIEDGWYWTIDWEFFFRGTLPSMEESMRGFTLILHLKMKYTGTFLFKDLYHNCIVRRGGEILYENHNPQSPKLAKVPVKSGDHLAIALFHEKGPWVWGGFLLAGNLERFSSPPDPVEVLFPYLQRVQEALRHPNGPPLKLFTGCFSPIGTVVSIYSLILNGGYVPSEIFLFGDHQWNVQQQAFLNTFLPFTHTVPTNDIITHLRSLKAFKLIQMAMQNWEVLKTVIALLYAPHEFCMVDDDIIVLDHLDDALEAFKTYNMVYTTNVSHEEGYVQTWKPVFQNPPVPLPTGNLNAGLYWLRNTKDPQVLVSQMQRVPMSGTNWLWEQGFLALAYVDNSFALSSQRYFMPLVDGLPGGIKGYDYRQNPCEFACLHFAGRMKPSNGTLLLELLPQILPH